MAEDSVKRGRGRPRTASGPRVNVYLGSDLAARTLRRDLEAIQKSHGHSSLGDSIRFLVEHWKSGSSVSDASIQVVPTANASIQCSLITDTTQGEQQEQRVHVLTVGSQCLPMQSYTPQIRDQLQMFSVPFVSIMNPPYTPLLQGQKPYQLMTGDTRPVPAPAEQEEKLQQCNLTSSESEARLSSQTTQKKISKSPDTSIKKAPPPKRRMERASITDTTKKALLECIETRKSSHSNPRNRGRRGRKRGQRTT